MTETNNLRHVAKKDTALIWAIKWVDYSDTNQGFGYQLSDGSYGVLFENETKIMLLPDEQYLSPPSPLIDLVSCVFVCVSEPSSSWPDATWKTMGRRRSGRH